MEVFLPKEENRRPGLLFINFEEEDVLVSPEVDSEEDILLLSFN